MHFRKLSRLGKIETNFSVTGNPMKIYSKNPSSSPAKAERGRGIEAIKDQQIRQRRFGAELVQLCRKWPSITPADIDRRDRNTSHKKASVHAVNLEPGKESIILAFKTTATGKQVKARISAHEEDVVASTD